MNTAAQEVSLVIPGRNAAGTIAACLDAVVPLLDRPGLAEIIFVDDGSTDDTRAIVSGYPVQCVAGRGEGPAAARNLGWQVARSPLVWFVDSDCVAEPDALERLLPHMQDPAVGGVSGSYGNMRPDSLLACLIHEEIIERHLRMSTRVNFAATFNVLYRRSILESLGGFDTRYLKGQDAEFSWRMLAAGHELAFEIDSRVKHFHEDRWLKYFRTQRLQGYWRVFLHLNHRGHARGDSYSSALDHIQPPLAMLVLASLPLLAFRVTWFVPLVMVGLLLLTQVPMTWRLMRRTGQLKYAAFAWMGFWRAFWRGIGLSQGTLAALRGQHRTVATTPASASSQPRA
jgi:glycosyltransferase involved in cell wall biosynthesis